MESLCCLRSDANRTKKGTRRSPLLVQPGRSGHRVERLLEPAGVALLGLGEGREPGGDLAEAFLARGARHARIHIGVFVRLARYRGLAVGRGLADREARRRIAAHLEELEMTVRVAGFTLGGRAEDGGDVVVAF